MAKLINDKESGIMLSDSETRNNYKEMKHELERFITCLKSCQVDMAKKEAVYLKQVNKKRNIHMNK